MTPTHHHSDSAATATVTATVTAEYTHATTPTAIRHHSHSHTPPQPNTQTPPQPHKHATIATHAYLKSTEGYTSRKWHTHLNAMRAQGAPQKNREGMHGHSGADGLALLDTRRRHAPVLECKMMWRASPLGAQCHTRAVQSSSDMDSTRSPLLLNWTHVTVPMCPYTNAHDHRQHPHHSSQTNESRTH